MSLKVNHPSKHAPFFPPGISHLKVANKYSSGTRAQSVKECKSMTKSVTLSQGHGFKDSNRLHRLSISTPNLKGSSFSDNYGSIERSPKVDVGHFDGHHSYLGGGSVHSRDMTRSLDRLPTNQKSMSNTGFRPDRPFYPPSKYPNIHNNSNLQRLVETRDKYKTPRSREVVKQLARTQSMMSIHDKVVVKEKQLRKTNEGLKKAKIFSSEPNISKEVTEGKTQLKIKEKFVEQNPEKLSSKYSGTVTAKIVKKPKSKLTTSFFYPNQDTPKGTDRMAQSLLLERSLASKIGTGSLTREKVPSQQRFHFDIIDPEENSAKSTTAQKQLNSFSQDSLDGPKNKPTNQDQFMNNGQSPRPNYDDPSLDSDCGISTPMSGLEDDHPKYQSASQTTFNDQLNGHFIDYFQGKGDGDQYNIDQITNQNLDMKAFNSIAFEDKNGSISIKNEFLSNAEILMTEYEDKKVLKPTVTNNDTLFPTGSAHNQPQHLSTDDFRDFAVKDQHCIVVDHMTKRMLDDDDGFMNEERLQYLNDTEISKEKDDPNLFVSVGSTYDISKAEQEPLTDDFVTNDNTVHEEAMLDDHVNNIPCLDDMFLIDINRMEDENQHKSLLIESEILLDDRISQNYKIDSDWLNELNKDTTAKQSIYESLRVEEDLLKHTARFTRQNGPTDSQGDRETDEIHVERLGDTFEVVQETDHYVEEIVGPTNDFEDDAFRLPEAENFDDVDVRKGDEDNISEDMFKVQKDDWPDVGSLNNTHHSVLNTMLDEYDQGEIEGCSVANVDDNYLNRDSYEPGDSDSTQTSSANDLSWSGYDGNKSFTHHLNEGGSIQQSSVSWLSSPELYDGNNNVEHRRGRHTQIENPLKPLCNSCHKPAYFMERISISNIIFHKSCFRCRKCQTHLNFNNCIIHHKRPYCQVHMRPKNRRSVTSVSTNKLSHIKSRLDAKSGQPQKTEVGQQKTIVYEGIKSAKTKFFDDATKSSESVRSLKRITPPRRGVYHGVLESEPMPRDPNVVACGDYQSSYSNDITLLTQSTSTKETRAHFKQLQERANSLKEGDLDGPLSGRRSDLVSVDTKSLRNRFLLASNDSDNKVKKINPSEEIQRLVRSESTSAHDNESGSYSDTPKQELSNDGETVPVISRNKAKELKERFTNFAQEEKPKKSQFKLDYGEGGIYESNPQENDEDVVRHNYDTNVYLPKNTVKSGLQKIKDLQDIKSKGYQKNYDEPFKIDVDPSLSGVYESVPEQSKADSLSHQTEDNMKEFKDKSYTNEAKKVLLEKTKQEENAALKRSTPHMIDIWKDLCPDSGVFENKPLEQRQDVVKYNESTDRLVTETSEEVIESEDNNHTNSQ